MELQSRVARLAALLDENPKIEREAGLSALTAKLKKAIDDFLAKSEAAIYRNTAEYAELAALLTIAQNKSLVTPDWLNSHDVGKKFTKAGKKEKEEFALMAVKAGIAADLIKEMKESPRRKMEDELNSMALANDDEVAAKLKAMKPAQIQALCEFNNIPIARNAKNAVDKKKTRPYILQKLSELREYAKLTRS